MAGGYNDFDLTAIVDGSIARVIIKGELDTDSAPRLIATLHDIAVPPRKAVELDCAAVTFLDTAGVRAFIVARNEATRNGVDLVLVHPSAPVSRTMEMTGLFGFLRVSGSP